MRLPPTAGGWKLAEAAADEDVSPLSLCEAKELNSVRGPEGGAGLGGGGGPPKASIAAPAAAAATFLPRPWKWSD